MEDFRDQFLSSVAVPITVKTVPVNVEDSLLSLVAGTAARAFLTILISVPIVSSSSYYRMNRHYGRKCGRFIAIVSIAITVPLIRVATIGEEIRHYRRRDLRFTLLS